MASEVWAQTPTSEAWYAPYWGWLSPTHRRWLELQQSRWHCRIGWVQVKHEAVPQVRRVKRATG